MSRRIPWVAALMSVVLPGFGQIYNGQVNRGIWFFLVFVALLLPVTALTVLYFPPVVMMPVLLMCTVVGLLAWFYSVVDAFGEARRQQEFIPKAWQTPGFYALVLVMFCFVVLPLVFSYVRQNQVQAFAIPSASMTPTLQPGDFIFADMRYNSPNCLVCIPVVRGDIVLFVYPNNRTQYYIKRVIGLPGDSIDISNGQVSLNGSPLLVSEGDNATVEEYEGKQWSISDNAKKSEAMSLVVAQGHVFVMGDNRGKSNDSRFFGSVPLADVVGKARQIWFSKNDDAIQWDRVGQVIE